MATASPIVTIPANTNVAPGNFTPGAYAALSFAGDIINATWSQANTKSDAFTAKIDAIGTSLAGTPVAHITSDVASTNAVNEPNVAIPTSIDTSTIMSLYTAKYQELVAMLVDKFTTFQSTYFPSDSATYNAMTTWVNGALANPNQAIPAAVAAQILTDDSNRAYTEANTQADALLAVFASRRFPLPPGAAASGVLQIQQKSQDVVAESSRKLMMNYVEQMKFAVEKSITMRQSAMQSTVQYIQALAGGQDTATKVIGIGYDAQSKLISSASSFYGARSEAQRVLNQAEQFNVTTKLQKDEKNQSIDAMIVEERIKALLGEAQTLGQMASAMFNNLHASSGTSYGVSA